MQIEKNKQAKTHENHNIKVCKLGYSRPYPLTLCGMVAYRAKCSHSMFRAHTTVKCPHATQENTLYSGLRLSLHMTQETTLYVQDPDHSEASPRDIGETARKIPQTYYAFHFELLIFFVFSGIFYFYIILTFNYGAPQKTVTHSLRSWGLMEHRKVNMGHCKYGRTMHCKYGWTMNNCDLHRSLSFC